MSAAHLLDLIELIDLRTPHSALRNVHLFRDTPRIAPFRAGAGRGSMDRAAAPAIAAVELGDQVELVHRVGREQRSTGDPGGAQCPAGGRSDVTCPLRRSLSLVSVDYLPCR